MKLIITLLLTCISLFSMAQGHFESYKIYNAKGKEVSIKKVNKEILKKDVVFLGELHDNPISHWLFLELIKEGNNNQKGKIQVGAEMFERDNQVIIDEYFQNIISKSKFENECRLWDNYSTDYKPTLEFCKSKEIDFVATNIPRRYASTVYKQGEKGLSKLSEEAKKWLAPFPIAFDSNLAVYQELQSFSGHGGVNLAKAQAYKDATMAYFINKSIKENHIYFHLNGNKHSEGHEGILWYLNKSNPKLKTLTIQTETNKDLAWKDSYSSKADFILVVQEGIK